MNIIYIGCVKFCSILLCIAISGGAKPTSSYSGTDRDTVKKKLIDPVRPDYSSAPLQDWEKKFSDFAFLVYQKNGHMLPYRLYSPPNPIRGKKYPLVVFLHGAGERGEDNRYQFFRFNPVKFWEKYTCYVLAPQCPDKGKPDVDNVWVPMAPGATPQLMRAEPAWPLELVMGLLEKEMRSPQIDPRRIYITGLSMGGFATWELLERMPGKFAAAMPLCGGGDLAFAAQFSAVPLWVFHGDADATIPVSRSRDMVAAIRQAGGQPQYTEYPGVGHDCWGVTYSRPEVWAWLFEQTKK